MFVFDNVLTAGTVLVRQQIESQDWESSGHTSGWAILADGTAYFFNVTAAGNIIAKEVLTNGGVVPFLHIWNDLGPTLDFETGSATETFPGHLFMGFENADPNETPFVYIESPATADGSTTLQILSPVAGLEGGLVFTGSYAAFLNTRLQASKMRAQKGNDGGPISTASTTFVNGASTAAAAVTTPLSGTLLINVTADIANSVAANAGDLTFELRENNAAGAILVPANVGRAARCQGTNRTSASATYLAEGIVTTAPILYARAMFASDNAANTATFRRIYITLIPIL